MNDTAWIVDIPEYSETDLVAGEELAGDPAFWLVHLTATMGDLSMDAEEAAGYGVAPHAFEAMMEHLSDPELEWPVFRVPFGGGHTALVVYANFEDENTVEFAVRHPEWNRLGYLAQYGPESTGPGLSWAELTAIAESVPDDVPDGEGLTDPAQRMLLLLPALGDAATPDDAWTVVAQDLVSCGIPDDAAVVLAQELLGTGPRDRYLEPSWAVTRYSPIPVCSSAYSPRRGPLAAGISPDQAQALADALRGGGLSA